MDNVIIADKDGKEIRTAVFSSYDFEVGSEENSFQLMIKRSEWESIPSVGRIYIPGTEYGGLYRKLETNTQQGYVAPGGITWRGMLKHKILRPISGQDYAYDQGELNAIIRNRIAEAFPAGSGQVPIIGSTEDTGYTIGPNSWVYSRYCTLLDGLEYMLNTFGYRLNIEYDQTQRAAVVSAVPVVDYSEDEEFSSDMQMDYIVKSERDLVSHLICLGNGELKNRTVIDLYRVGDEILSPSALNPFPNGGVDDIQEVYDYAGAEYMDLYNAGVERLRQIKPETYEILLQGSRDIGIGDIVGGRDYLTGYYLKAPIAGKIVRWDKGFRTIEYIVSPNVEISRNAYIPDEPEVEPVE